GPLGDAERGDLGRTGIAVGIGADHLQVVRQTLTAHGEGDQRVRGAAGVAAARSGAYAGELLDGVDRLGQVRAGEDHMIECRRDGGGDGGVVGHVRLRWSTAEGRIGTRLAGWNTVVSVFQRGNRVPTGGRVRRAGVTPAVRGTRATGSVAPGPRPAPVRPPGRMPPTPARAAHRR